MLNGCRIGCCNVRVLTFACYRPTPNYSIVRFWKVRRKSNFAQVGIEYTDGQLYVQRSPFETQPPHTGTEFTMIAPPYELLPSMSFPNFRLIVFLLPPRKNSAGFSKLLLYFFTFLKIAYLKLRKLGVIAFPKGTDKLGSLLVTPNIEMGRFACMKVIEF